MESAVDNLESMFQKAEADLNVLSRRLQVECTQGFHNENNPMKLMAKIEDIKSEYSTLVKEIAMIQTAQKETVDSIRSMIWKMINMLSQLESQSESPEADSGMQAMYEELSKLLGISNLPQADHSLTSVKSSASGNTVDTATLVPRASTSDPSLDATEKDKPRETGIKQLSALDRRMHCSDFQEVTQEEFLSVSELVRGKVKLADLNRTYKMLWQHCKEEGHREPLSPKHMNNMGLRVSGATGEAKLKVLRSLKLCQISKTGDVKLA